MISVTFLFCIDTIESDAFDASSNRGLLRGQVPDCWDQALLLNFLPPPCERDFVHVHLASLCRLVNSCGLLWLRL